MAWRILEYKLRIEGLVVLAGPVGEL